MQKKRFYYNTFDIINTMFLVVLSFICFYPFWMVVIASFNEGKDFMRGGVYWWPRVFSLNNYIFAFKDNRLIIGLRISVARTIIGTFASVFFTSVVAYGMSLRNLKYKNITFYINLITIFFGGGLIPYFLLIKQLQLINTFWVYILPSLYSVFNMIIISNFFRDVPLELHESAMIDGMSEFNIFLRVYLPLSKPALATVALWVAVGHWNSYFDSMLFTTKPELQTLQLFLYKLIKESAAAQEYAQQAFSQELIETISYSTIRYATMVIATVPILCVYPFVQRYFAKGIMLGSLKG